MSRIYSLAYLTSCALSPTQAVGLAAELGYAHVGLRLLPNAPGARQQHLIDRPEVLRETIAAQRDTGVGVLDLEIIRIGEDFDERRYLPLLEAGAALRAGCRSLHRARFPTGHRTSRDRGGADGFAEAVSGAVENLCRGFRGRGGIFENGRPRI